MLNVIDFFISSFIFIVKCYVVKVKGLGIVRCRNLNALFRNLGRL